MTHRQLVRAIARRFPDLTQRQIDDVLDVLAEVCRAELAQSGGEIVIRDLGRLTIEVQRVKTSGAIRAQMGSSAPDSLTRLYFRFRPTPRLRAEIEAQLKKRA